MRKSAMLGLALVALLLPIGVRAQVTLGARAGWALGLGDVGGSLAMRDWVESQVPLQLDVLYRVRPKVAFGGFVSYGLGRTGGDLRAGCAAPGAGCSASIVRLGAQGAYTFGPVANVLPWLGAGIAYEWNRVGVDDPGGDVTFTGLEYLTVQGGADWARSKLSFGPYVSFSVGQYEDVEAADLSRDVDRRTHVWLGVGVRGKIDL